MTEARTAENPATPAPVPMPAELRRVADAAKGFLPPDEAAALYDAAWATARRGPLLEVGTYCGKSATYLGAAARARGGHVVTVDHHRGSEENQPGWEWHDPELVDRAVAAMDTLPFFRRTMHAAGLEDVVVAVVGRSRTVASLWSTPLAMLFIDGGHSAEHCIDDYAGWTPHLMPGGVLAIHDVFPDPADGGQAPYEHIYLPALRDGCTEVRHVGSLRVLLKPDR
ncbi:MAG TPA: class I SAM-dependent methyltransferase [Mycobacteriales bacterium]|nr:class I SAM-dependent methyltransferase [Mycobacteriales bacterium]